MPTPKWPGDHSEKHSEAAKLGWQRRKSGYTSHGAKELAQEWKERLKKDEDRLEALRKAKASRITLRVAKNAVARSQGQVKEWERRAQPVNLVKKRSPWWATGGKS